MKSALLVILMAGTAFAQGSPPPGGAATLAAEAEGHFEAGRYYDAVQTYRRAYAVEPLSELLYNIAFIYDRKLDEPEVARIYYRRFVRSRDTDRTTRLKAFERLDAIESSGLVMAPPLRVAPVAAGAAPVTAAPRAAAPVTPVADGDGARTAAWIAIGVGAAATITGATFAALATHSHSQFEDAEDAAARRKLADEGEQRALLGDVGLGLGLAGLAVGGVLYLLSDDEAVSLGVTPTPGGAGVGFGGRF